jgi:arylamine N-acetyltransferase
MSTDETPQSTDTTIIKNTPEQVDTPQTTVEPIQASATDNLSIEEIRFVSLVVQGYSLTTAYRKAFPAKKSLGYDTIRQYASRLFTKSNIQSEVTVRRDTLARLARLSEDRIEDTLINGKTGSRAVTDVSLAMYEHANGKAKQTTEVISRSVSVNIDLTSPTLTEVENL